MKFNITHFFPHDHLPSHIKSLDGIRGLAVLLVVFSHAERANILILPFQGLAGSGKTGVVIFFVLSAYLLDMQIINRLISGKASNIYWFNYALRRFLRIIPLFCISALLVVTLDFRGAAVYWSIPVELKYYFISPILLICFNKLLKWRLRDMMIVFISLVLMSIVSGYLMQWSAISTFPYLYVFLFGTIMALWQTIYPLHIEKIFKHWVLDWIWPILLVIGILCFPIIFKSIFGDKIPNQLLFNRLLWTIIASITIVASQIKEHWISRLLETKFLRFIGNISFSIYLFHMPILGAISTFSFIPKSLKGPVVFIAVIIFASVTYRLIEYPLSKVRIKKRQV